MGFTINLSKENFKFSGTHFTIFGRDQAERMHGHNYQVTLQIYIADQLDPKLGLAFDFNSVKPIIKSLCDDLDEYILIPEHSPYLKIKKAKKTIIVHFSKKTYSMPIEDVRILPIANVTIEELARLICKRLIRKWTSRPDHIKLALTVEETRGQSVTYEEDFR